MHLLRDNGPTVAAFLVFVFLFAVFAGTFGPGAPAPGRQGVLEPAVAIPLPAPGEDADGDTYADDVDLWDGDLVIDVEVLRLSAPGGDDARPYLLVGTQDDHWRTGAGAEAEWRRVYDHDPLGHTPGSPEWIASALRTGSWWRSIPMAGESHAIAHSGVIEAAEPGALWPQVFHVNVRDDRPRVALDIEVWDAQPRPSALRGVFTLEVDVVAAAWRSEGEGDGAWRAAGEAGVVGSLAPGGVGLEVALALGSALNATVQQALAQRWAPVVAFDEAAAFFPTRGEALERFHGFWHREPDHRTWSRSFNNGRDTYRLLLADFTGSGGTDHRDAVVLTDVLRAGDVGRDTVYAHVTRTTGGQIAVQYWFLYFYNFVPDEAGRDVAALAHAGDREFMQLVFADLEAAQTGTPTSVSYSQHYGGVSVPFVAGEPPFHVDPDHPAVFVALGSHASYPVAGTDEALRSALAGFGDVFRGDGEVWQPGDYDIEVLGAQTWHAGYLWGPYTRHSRDLGTPLRPLLQHGFAYPFLDPLHWESTLRVVEADRLVDLYGGAP